MPLILKNSAAAPKPSAGGLFNAAPSAATELQTDLLMGDSGSGKSRQLAAAAFHTAKTKGKKTLLVTADGGSLRAYTPLIELGIVKVLPLLIFPDPIGTMNMTTRGMWPVEVRRGEWTFKHPQANKKANHPEWFDEYGLLIYESLGSIVDAVSRFIRSSNFRGTIPGTPDRDKFYVAGGGDDDTRDYFGGLAQVGYLQDKGKEWIHSSSQLPFDKVLWSARIKKGDDEGTPIYGPQLAGSAVTADIPGWFGGCYHLESISSEEVVEDDRADVPASSAKRIGNSIRKQQFRMYFMNHPDPFTGVMYTCKSRVPAVTINNGKPYIDCTAEHPNDILVPGITTIWDIERESHEELTEATRAELSHMFPKTEQPTEGVT